MRVNLVSQKSFLRNQAKLFPWAFQEVHEVHICFALNLGVRGLIEKLGETGIATRLTKSSVVGILGLLWRVCSLVGDRLRQLCEEVWNLDRLLSLAHSFFTRFRFVVVTNQMRYKCLGMDLGSGFILQIKGILHLDGLLSLAHTFFSRFFVTTWRLSHKRIHMHQGDGTILHRKVVFISFDTLRVRLWLHHEVKKWLNPLLQSYNLKFKWFRWTRKTFTPAACDIKT